MKVSENTKVGFIGFGAANSVFAKGMIGQGLKTAVAYDVIWDQDVGPDVESEMSRVKKLGIEPVRTIRELAEQSDVVISAVTPSAALEVAGKCFPWLSDKKLYADINTKTPKMARQIAEKISLSHALFVDGAAVGSVAKFGAKVPLLVSGGGAADFAELSRFGLKLDVVGNEPGQAAAIKILRSIYTKGVAAILCELLVAASRLGVMDWLMKNLEATENEFGFSQMVDMRFRETLQHAARRAYEMSEVAETLESAGLDSTMTRAAEKVIQRISSLGKLRMETLPTNLSDLASTITERLLTNKLAAKELIERRAKG